MTRLMGGDEQTLGLVGTMVVSMSDEPEVLEDLPDDNCNFLTENDLKIYVAGTLRFFHIEYGIMSHVYMLTSIQGQPALTPETNFVSIGAAVDSVNDLLFYGGDNAQKPFSCLQRVERDSTLAISSVSNNVGDNTPRQ